MKKMNKIKKATEGDKRDRLSDAVYYQNPDERYTYLKDYDDNFLYISSDSTTYKVPYTYSEDTRPVIDFDNKVEVVMGTEVLEVMQSVDKSLLDKFLSAFSGTESKGIPVLKQFDELEYTTLEPLYVAANEVDGVGDTLSVEDTYGMVE